MVQFLCLLGLFAQGGRQLGHFLLERLTVVFDLGCADIAARGENVIMPAYVVGRCGFAETGDILVGANLCVRLRIGADTQVCPYIIAAPCVVGVGYLADVVVGQFSMNAVDQGAQLAGVDEERLAASIPESAVLFIAGDEPEADRNLG